MSLARVEEEISHRIAVFDASQVERVTVSRAQIVFYPPRDFDGRRRAARDFGRKRVDSPVVIIWQLQITSLDFGRIGARILLCEFLVWDFFGVRQRGVIELVI